MKPVLITLLGIVVLSGCASQPRTDAAAPVESSRSKAPVVASEPTPAPPKKKKKETVEVYAYRPPATAPDAVPPEPQAVVTDTRGTAGTMVALTSESATPKPSASNTASPVASSETASAPVEVDQSVPKVSPPSERVEVAPAPAPAPEIVTYSAPPPPMPQLAPAVGALASQAERQRQMGDYVGAAATLERALRIEPREAFLYNRLARVRMEQGSYAQAGNFAQRSNSLAKDQPQLKQDNWGMIAVARRVTGDAAGAAEAETKAHGG